MKRKIAKAVPTIMSREQIVRAAERCLILADRLPLFGGATIEYNGKPLTLFRFHQIMVSDQRLKQSGLDLPQREACKSCGNPTPGPRHICPARI